ncbi:hypothetical protein E2C01_045153 [Portunus trituberculatus]|uniref:Uncharacterized protein n=1 Tax=Portunus trituberculatus TaxID=210409 RepID=A0A5B7G2D5_PORTR|nr:hypothetical protein [Portunus trituberculatus]
MEKEVELGGEAKCTGPKQMSRCEIQRFIKTPVGLRLCVFWI